MNMIDKKKDNILTVVRTLITQLDQTVDEAVKNSVVPEEIRDEIKAIIEAEQTVKVRPPKVITRATHEKDWVEKRDKSQWYFWPTLERHLITAKGFSQYRIAELDKSTDGILSQLAPPETDEFDVRGLVLGYVQSGKTGNFSALIAKAVDAGYKFVIVLSGMHNQLRRQTQVRLEKELVGCIDNTGGDYVPFPRRDKRWLTITSDDLKNGDFKPGNIPGASVQGQQPVLMVVKKNGHILANLLDWINTISPDIRADMPALIIDDESDQASINTGGNVPDNIEDSEEPDRDQEEPTVINGRIRKILNKFNKSAYVAYTATPFANILIDHNARDKQVGQDLYPRDFIVDLEKPKNYCGAEKLFGNFDDDAFSEEGGLDVIRRIEDTDLASLIPAHRNLVDDFQPEIPDSLENALYDFIIGGAVRRLRQQGSEPVTMLVHVSLRTVIQDRLAEKLKDWLAEIKSQWRHASEVSGLMDILRVRWETSFVPIIENMAVDACAAWPDVAEAITAFLREDIMVLQINSASNDDETLDFERNPSLKAIVVGGNRLSRGLTLEGLMVSYYVRRTIMYDTLMQMGRWFGFRLGYEDLTRIHMTETLASWFHDLAEVEARIRSDIAVYEQEGITPLQVGARILAHPTMIVTSRLKSKDSRMVVATQSYSGKRLYTSNFPENDLEFLRNNISVTEKVIEKIGKKTKVELSPKGSYVYSNVDPVDVLDYLNEYKVHENNRTFNTESIAGYIRKRLGDEELTKWVVAIIGNQKPDPVLKPIRFPHGVSINPSSRSRKKLAWQKQHSIIHMTTLDEPNHREIGLNSEQLDKAARTVQTDGQTLALAKARGPRTGLLLIYPVSKYSGHEADKALGKNAPLFDNPELATDIIGLSLCFPVSERENLDNVIYVEGTVNSDFEAHSM